MIRLFYDEELKERMAQPNDPSFSEDRDRLHLQMMSAVSHDLKTPLASIIGSLEIHDKMKAALSDEKKEILLKTALQEAYRLDGFITNILDMARLENGMTKINKRHCELDQVAQDCVQKVGDLTNRADIQIVKPRFSTSCYTDATLLSRAIQCVLDNAMKHSGNAQPRIQIDFSQKDHMLFTHIRDDGTGIPNGEEEKIFSKYTRLAKKDYKNAGTGLGLTIARAIVNLLGGSIYLEPQDEGQDSVYKGAVFTIAIPVE